MLKLLIVSEIVKMWIVEFKKTASTLRKWYGYSIFDIQHGQTLH